MKRCVLFLALVWLVLPASPARAEMIRVTITNLQPSNGTFLTPVFFGTHDGVYDFFNNGGTASSSVERLAEDGTTGPRIAAALATGRVFEALVTGGGAIAPGQSRDLIFNVSSTNSRTQFLSFMSMVIPSNDAFIGNDNPQAIALFDASGNLIERTGVNAFRIFGNDVWDAGTEVNDEVPLNTAFLGQVTPNTGLVEAGLIHRHLGFQGSAGLSGPIGNILTAFPGGDFTLPGTQIASISIRAVPEPSSLALFAVGGSLLVYRGFRRRRASAGV